MIQRYSIAVILCLLYNAVSAQNNSYQQKIQPLITAVEPKVIAWRRDFHENPELGNREVRTAGIIARHLQSLGIEVKTQVAKTGVVGILKGGLPGPVIALRADMDALPVTENTGLPFASKVKTTYNNQETGVMHACGHDAHVAILMGVAEILASQKATLKGTVKFIFQPAEEGAPKGEEGGAALMIKEGVLENPAPEVIFGLHVWADRPAGTIGYKPEGTMASACDFKITVTGKPSHGSRPWNAVDPIVTAAQIVTGLQTIVSRNINLTENAAVVTVGAIQGGNRFNIIPEKAELIGTVRALSTADEQYIYKRVKEIANGIAQSANATATVEIPYTTQYPVTYNNPALTKTMLPTLQQAAGAGNVQLIPATTGAEDFSFYAQKIPGLFFFLGVLPKGKKPTEAAPHHTPEFFVDENGLKLGIETFILLVHNYAENK